MTSFSKTRVGYTSYCGGGTQDGGRRDGVKRHVGMGDQGRRVLGGVLVGQHDRVDAVIDQIHRGRHGVDACQ